MIRLRNATIEDIAILKDWDNQQHVIDSDPNDLIGIGNMSVNSNSRPLKFTETKPQLLQDFNLLLTEIEKERIPSINARIKNLTNASR